MSFENAPSRLWPKLRPVLFAVAILAAAHLASFLTGFGDWLHGTPAAIVVVRVLAVLLFGSSGLLLLAGARYDPELKSLGYRLAGSFLLLLCIPNAVLLLNGEAAFSNLLPE